MHQKREIQRQKLRPEERDPGKAQRAFEQLHPGKDGICGTAQGIADHRHAAGEKTPHLHLCFVPLTADGRLSAKEIIGNRKNLVKWQDEFWQHMVKQYPELERGESASQPGREHIPPRIFKEMTQLTKQKEQLDALLMGITPFNGKSRAAEISKVLDSYIPAVSKMRTELNRYQVAFTETAAENEKLKEKNKTLSASLDKAKEGSVLKRLEDAKLRQDYEAALKTLDSIPPEVIRFYENRTQESVVRHDK